MSKKIQNHSGKNNPNFRHGLRGTKEERTYKAMKTRCNNHSADNYKYYGGRGIKFLYKNLLEFVNDVGLASGKEYSIDRIDNNGNYEIGNCKWSTLIEQGTNRSTTNFITHNGVTQSHAQWARELGITHVAIRNRINRGKHPITGKTLI